MEFELHLNDPRRDIIPKGIKHLKQFKSLLKYQIAQEREMRQKSAAKKIINRIKNN